MKKACKLIRSTVKGHVMMGRSRYSICCTMKFFFSGPFDTEVPVTVEVFEQLILGDLLRRHRKDASLSQKALGHLLDYSDTVVSRVENGEHWPLQVYIDSLVSLPELALTDTQTELILQLYRRGKRGVVKKRPFLIDWGEAPDVSVFYGREQELQTLQTWVVQDRCRLLGVLGMGGMGKTWLTTRLAQNIIHDFDIVLWRSLRNAPMFTEIVSECLQILSDQPPGEQINDAFRLISALLKLLQQKRCLLILDNVEAILEPGFHVGHYRAGYEMYGVLWQRMGETDHQSCVILTSREQPNEFVRLASSDGGVRMLSLAGFDVPHGRELLQDRKLHGELSAWTSFIKRYAGNPLALRTISASIEMLYGGNILTFLQEITTMFGEINFLLQQQFERLAPLEKDILLWLAVVREPVSIPELQAHLVQPVSPGELAEALASLARRSLIETGNGRFTLQNVILEFMTSYLIERVCEEITLGKITLFNNHALMKSTAKVYVRTIQKRLFLVPVAMRLVKSLGKEGLVKQLMAIIEQRQRDKPYVPGYAGGNIINLLLYLKQDLTGFDFSNLAIWQAHLRNIELQGINFAQSDLFQCAFMETFGIITTIAFHPQGMLLAAGTESGEIRLWRLTDGKQLPPLKGHYKAVHSITFSPDGGILASSGGDFQIRLWDSKSWQNLKTLQGHTESVWTIKFSPDGKLLASGSRDRTIRLWNLSTYQCIDILSGHKEIIWSIAFSSDGKTLASSSRDQTIRLWDVTTKQHLKTLKGHHDLVLAIAFNPTDDLLVGGSRYHGLYIWDVNSSQLLQTLEGHHSDTILAICMSKDGKLLASSSRDHTIRLWDLKAGKCIKTLHGHANSVEDIALSPDGKMLASGSFDQTVRLWNIQSGQCLKILRGNADIVRSIDEHPNRHLVASGGQALRLWDIDKGICLKTLEGYAHMVYSVAFSPDGTLLASSRDDYVIRLWDMASMQLLTTLTGHSNNISSLAFNPEGSILASGGRDHTIRLWDVKNNQFRNVLRGHADQIKSVAFNSSGRILASGSRDFKIKLWNVETGQCMQTLRGHSRTVRTVSFNPTGHLLASGSGDQTIRLWDAHNGTCEKILKGHLRSVYSIQFSLDGKMLASGSGDRTIRLWDIRSGECMKVLEGHSGLILSIELSHDGKRLISSGIDEMIKVWDIQTGKCIKTLQAKRPYAGMNIAGATGLTDSQRASLIALGAVT
ncbi:MAG: hypothetical protein DWQ04_04820 [Chloroflexi bacterium]|nr:MAG: hypothetical protein DWQ04_04820 [Chloroflexota bacterium]